MYLNESDTKPQRRPTRAQKRAQTRALAAEVLVLNRMDQQESRVERRRRRRWLILILV